MALDHPAEDVCLVSWRMQGAEVPRAAKAGLNGRKDPKKRSRGRL